MNNLTPLFLMAAARCKFGFNLSHQSEMHGVVSDPVMSTVMASSALKRRPGDCVVGLCESQRL